MGKRASSILAGAAGVLFAWGCGPYLTVTPQKARPGAELTLTLHNPTAGPVLFNLCSAAPSRPSRSGGWESAPDVLACSNAGGCACILILESLGPMSSSSAPKQLSGTAPTGEYRITTSVESFGKTLELGTSFRID